MKIKKIIINEQETRYFITSEGNVINSHGRQLKGTFTKEGYVRVQLTLPTKHLKSCLVHRLVAEAFCENPNNYKVVDHINRIKSDNRATNLRWASYSENSLNIEKKVKKSIEEEDICVYYDKSTAVVLKENPNYLINQEGQVFNLKSNKILRGSERQGYRRICLNGKYHSIHRLVYENFVGQIPKNMVIDHINGDRSDNRLQNLRCVSQNKNMDNAYKNGHKGAVKVK